MWFYHWRLFVIQNNFISAKMNMPWVAESYRKTGENPDASANVLKLHIHQVIKVQEFIILLGWLSSLKSA